MSLGKVTIRSGSQAVGTSSSATVAATLAQSILDDSYCLYVVSGSSAAARTVTTPPSNMSTLLAQSVANTTFGDLFIFGGFLGRGAAAPSVVLSGAGSWRTYFQEFLNVDRDNPVVAVTALDSTTTSGASNLGSHSITTDQADELILTFLGARGQPTGISLSGGLTATEAAQTTTSGGTLGVYTGQPVQPGSQTPNVAWSGNSLGAPALGLASVALRPRQASGWGLRSI